jgi:hypothetical protein
MRVLSHGRAAKDAGQHPRRHGQHHQILAQRDEAERDVASASDAGAFDIALVDIESLGDYRPASGAGSVFLAVSYETVVFSNDYVIFLCYASG